MDRVPVKNGKKCVFRVVRVSGTIRKSQEEAIKRAREVMFKARQEMGEQSDSTLDSLFGKEVDHNTADSANDILMVDNSDSEEEEDSSDG
jgi:ribonuclease P/MRP protein subunit POP5